MFRSLVRYNPHTETYEGDIANCDLTDLSRVQCTLNKNLVWSDGTPIQSEDIWASIDGYKRNVSDETMKLFLQWVNFSEKNGIMTLSSKTKNPLMADLLLYPILRSDMVEQIKTERFQTGNYVTSGLYVFSGTTNNAEYGFDAINLERNEKYSGGEKSWFDRVNFRFFQNIGSLERGAETLTVVIPPNMSVTPQISERFKPYTYTSYEYFGIFFHTDRLSRSFRNLLHWQIGTSFSGKIDPKHKPIDTIFPWEEAILPKNIDGSFGESLRKNGYEKRDDILERLNQTPSIITDTGSIVYDKVKFFTTNNQSSVIFVSDLTDGVSLTGKVPKFTQSVAINDYTLREYIPGNELYVYKVTPEAGTIKKWKNLYTLVLRNSDNAEIFRETLRVYYYESEEERKLYEKEVQDEYLARLNTPALIADRDRKKQEKIKTIQALDARYYYNDKNEPFTIKVAAISGPQSTIGYATEVEGILKKLWVKTETITYEPKEFSEMIRSGKKEYDILIVWVEAIGNIAKIGQIFLSSEAGKWINFANVQSKTLDDLFISLRSTNNPEKINEIESKIIDFMERESFFLPIASPYNQIWIDRNIKWITQLNIFQDMSSIYDVTRFASIRDTYILNTEWKGPIKFIQWIFHKATFQ